MEVSTGCLQGICLLAGMFGINGGSVRCYWLKSEAKCGKYLLGVSKVILVNILVYVHQ